MSLERVTASYGSRRVLENVSFALAPGEVVGLVGPNGAGKSTLLRVAAGLLTPRSGIVRLAGRPIAGLDRREIARSIAWLPQSEGTDLAFDVRAIVELGRLPHLGPFRPPGPRDREAIARALREAGIEGLASRPFPELSEGERQRVLLARCLAQEPAVLLLDEPTASLDVRHAWLLMDVVRARARAGAAVLAAIHDLALAARRCDRLLVLDGGRLVYDGLPEQALAPELVESVFGMRVRTDRADGAVTITVLGALR